MSVRSSGLDLGLGTSRTLFCSLGLGLETCGLGLTVTTFVSYL